MVFFQTPHVRAGVLWPSNFRDSNGLIKGRLDMRIIPPDSANRATPTPLALRFLALVMLSTLTACANWAEDGGVANYWREDSVPTWVEGETREQDVMAALGPPSQIVNLDDRVVYYYLHERMQGQGSYFILYNRSRQITRYDRAIFFFDREGVLDRYAYSLESIEREE